MIGPDDLEDDDNDLVVPAVEDDEDDDSSGSPAELEAPEYPDEPDTVGAVDAPAPRREPGRQERAVLAAKQAAREAKEEVERTRREFEDFRRQQTERRENPAELEARLAAMDPEQRINYRLDQMAASQSAATRSLEMTFKEQADKAAFAVQLAQDPGLKKYEADVEKIYAGHLADAKRTGGPLPDRATILPWVVGQRVLRSSAKAVEKGRKTGAANIARQTTRPASPRGDVSARGGRAQSLAEKLADVTF